VCEYGLLASYDVNGFRQRGLVMQWSPNAELLCSGDIRALADLANKYVVARGTWLVPITKTQVLRLAFFLALPHRYCRSP
jgi:hypothetical protein